MQLLLLISASLLALSQSYTYVSELNLEQYDGFWYEVYEDLFDETFQKGGRCVTAEYTLYENGTIEQGNTSRRY